MNTSTITPVAETWDLSEGEEIAPGRTALKRLGGGHRYDAYLAWDQRLHTVVVCKLVRPHLADDGHTLAGLAEEWAMLERLNHPVIVRGFDAVLDGPRPHIVLEHLEGPRLSTLIRRYGPLPADQLIPLALQLCAAIHYLGEANVVHLDIKPSNTIMGAPPRLIDLSVALDLEQAATLSSAVGTDDYMAPEQCLPEVHGPVTAAADVWGLGVTVFKAATGGLPFSEADDDPATPEQRWPQLVDQPLGSDRLPAPLRALILACLAFDPAARPTAEALHAQLEPLLEALPAPRLGRLKPRL